MAAPRRAARAAPRRPRARAVPGSGHQQREWQASCVRCRHFWMEAARQAKRERGGAGTPEGEPDLVTCIAKARQWSRCARKSA